MKNIEKEIDGLQIVEFPKDKAFKNITKEQAYVVGQAHMLFRVQQILKETKRR